MFDDILKMVKDHLGDHPDLQANLTPEQADAIHKEIATHLTNATQSQGGGSGIGGMLGGLLNKVESSVAGGGALTSAVEGGLVSSLTSKFGLPPSVTGAIAGALPGLLQKIAAKQQTAQ